jgi:hypothetical protein
MIRNPPEDGRYLALTAIMRGAGTTAVVAAPTKATARQPAQAMLVGAAGVDLSLVGRGADATVSQVGGLIRCALGSGRARTRHPDGTIGRESSRGSADEGGTR